MARRLKGLCRMCGERYAGLGSVDIYEDRGSLQPYYILLRDMMNLNPQPGDQKPDRLGLTCAKLLDDWAKFRKRCFETQKILKEKAAQMKTVAKPDNLLSNGASSSSQPSTSAAEPTTSGAPSTSSTVSNTSRQLDLTFCSSGRVIKVLKRPHSSESESDDDDNLQTKNVKKGI